MPSRSPRIFVFMPKTLEGIIKAIQSSLALGLTFNISLTTRLFWATRLLACLSIEARGRSIHKTNPVQSGIYRPPKLTLVKLVKLKQTKKIENSWGDCSFSSLVYCSEVDFEWPLARFLITGLPELVCKHSNVKLSLDHIQFLFFSRNYKTTM